MLFILYALIGNRSYNVKPNPCRFSFLAIAHLVVMSQSVRTGKKKMKKMQFKKKWLHNFVFNAQTLLLWSLILMMGSFFLRSHTTAFPLGLAEARMCWTCLFQDTTLMSSTGWEKKKKVHYYCPNRWPSHLHSLIKPVKDKHSLYLSTWTQRESRLWWLSFLPHRYESIECETRESCLWRIAVIMPQFTWPHQTFM